MKNKFYFLIGILILSCGGGLSGEYKCDKKSLYGALKFSGDKVIIKSDIMGIKQEFTSTFMKNGDVINIKTDKSDLVYKIIDSNTLKGEGFAEGTCSLIK